jgi:hypothetical protein
MTVAMNIMRLCCGTPIFRRAGGCSKVVETAGLGRSTSTEPTIAGSLHQPRLVLGTIRQWEFLRRHSEHAVDPTGHF